MGSFRERRPSNSSTTRCGTRTKDQQGSLSVDSMYDGESNRTQITYPGQFGGGRRTLSLSYDNVNRLSSISDSSGTIATYHYKGPSRLERRTYGLRCRAHLQAGSQLRRLPATDRCEPHHGCRCRIARFQYGHDRESHRLFEKRVHDGNQGDVYRYDSIYRVLRNPQNVNLSTSYPGPRSIPIVCRGPEPPRVRLRWRRKSEHDDPSRRWSPHGHHLHPNRRRCPQGRRGQPVHDHPRKASFQRRTTPTI